MNNTNNTDNTDNTDNKKKKKNRFRFLDSIWYILIFIFVWYMLVASLLEGSLSELVERSEGLPPAMIFILSTYTMTIFSVVLLLLLCLFPKNRAIGKSFIPNKKDRSWMKFGIGLILGFATNFICILCALIHGDISLYFDFAAGGIPVMLFAFLSVFIQSSSEELWTRGFMYERLNVRYPLWVAMLVNGIFFGFLHIFNPGANFLSIFSICVTGVSYSLLRWYSGSIWTCMGIHTMWNFTQNFLFGLPNSGLVSQVSIFHMSALRATSNPIYNYEFGVEGAIPAILVDAAVGIVCLLLGKKDGRLGELRGKK